VFAPRPTVTSVNPGSGLWGQSLPVIITGTNFTGATAVNFGTGITVNSFTVDSATQITANISIAGGSAPGSRDVSVTTQGSVATLTNGFMVIPLMPSKGSGSGSSSLPGAATSSPTVVLAAITVQSASLSAKSVTPGTPVTVTADIANKSTVNGIKKVTLYVNGQVETTQGVTVNSGGSSQLSFNVSRSEPGDYTVYVDGVPAGSFKVELLSGNDGILIFSAVLIALAFLVGMVMLRRRQQHTG
jgi:primosomal replication protein N